MRFSIITPTYKRAAELSRAVESVKKQTYSDWEIIIVNDSPTDESYAPFASSINDPRVHYHVNERNMGVNYTRNHALNKLSADSKWVIFLDDDDYLSPDALQTFHELILTHGEQKWFMTNRALKSGESLTRGAIEEVRYSYAWNYLILKRIKGDATHCIHTDLLHHIRFLHHIKQGEEWFFFYQVGLAEKIFYYDHNSTITDGYGELNYRKRTRSELFKTLGVIFYEGINRGFGYHPTFLLYIALRCVASLLR